MKFLERVNQIKEGLGLLKTEAESLNPESKESALKQIDEVIAKVNEIATAVESTERNKEAEKILNADLMAQMNSKEIFGGLDLKQKNAISEKILKDPSLSVLDENSLKSSIRRELANLNGESLALIAYTKEDFIRIGKSLVPNADQNVQFERGKQALISDLEKPTNFENALGTALGLTMKNASERNRYLLKYYGLAE